MEGYLRLFDDISVAPETLLAAALATGLLIAVAGASRLFAGEPAEVRRLRARSRMSTQDFDLIRNDETVARGLLRAFVPTSEKDRNAIRREFRRAGIQRKNAVRTYYLTRSLFGFGLPCLYVAAMQMPPHLQAAFGIEGFFAGKSLLWVMYECLILIIVGFYGPRMWLKRKIAARSQRIWEAMPNALDLLQVSIEAGLGFDAAIVRISHEISDFAPDLAAEFMMLQLEIQAGKSRQKAFIEMADRTGVPEMTSFANVILQASQFGTSISAALSTYADEMRLTRELKAQEKANRLPVQMSGVMAILMMPALLIICLAPMLIRWTSMFG